MRSLSQQHALARTINLQEIAEKEIKKKKSGREGTGDEGRGRDGEADRESSRERGREKGRRRGGGAIEKIAMASMLSRIGDVNPVDAFSGDYFHSGARWFYIAATSDGRDGCGYARALFAHLASGSSPDYNGSRASRRARAIFDKVRVNAEEGGRGWLRWAPFYRLGWKQLRKSGRGVPRNAVVAAATSKTFNAICGRLDEEV